jgi:hypothetical protein
LHSKEIKIPAATLAAETHLAEGRDLKLGQTWNRGKSLIIIIIIINFFVRARLLYADKSQ